MHLLNTIRPSAGSSPRLGRKPADRPNVAWNLGFTTRLIDHLQGSAAIDSASKLSLRESNLILHEIEQYWATRSCASAEEPIPPEYVRKLYSAMSLIERQMARHSSESETYSELQDCINMLDEVDLIFELSSAQR